MIERVVEYLANAAWQLPLLAVGAWWLLRAVRVGPLAQYRVWVAVLAMGVVLPLARVSPKTVVVRPVAMKVAALGNDMPDAGLRTVVPDERLGWWAEVLRRRSVEVSTGTARGLAGIYLALVIVGLVRIGRSLSAAQRLVAGAEDIALGEDLGVMLNDCGKRIGVRVPRVVESGEVSSPAVVGAVLVLPRAFIGFSEIEMRAALLHELAHVRRRDYAANLMCELAALPVVWHPASYAVRRRIRGTREMVCDAMAAGAMGSAKVYVRSLVGLAAKACVGEFEAEPMSVGLFTNNNLEERVMRLMETKQTVGARARVVRVLGAVAGMVAVVTLAAMVHVRPAMAQKGATGGPQEAPAAANGVAPELPAMPEPPALPGPPPALSAPAAPALPAAPMAPPLLHAPVAPALPGAPGPPPAPPAIPQGPEAALQLVPGAVIDDGGKDCPKGHATQVHRWVAADDQNFAVVNCKEEEPTAAEKKVLESKFEKEMAEAKLAQLDAQKQLAELNSPERMREMADLQREMAELQAQMKSPEFEKQMAELNSPAFQRQMAGIEKQLAEAGLDRLHTRLEMKQLDSAAMKRQMAAMNQQLAKLTSKEWQKQMQDQMKAAKEQVEAAQKQMEQERLRERAHPGVTCAEGCAATPQ